MSNQVNLSNPGRTLHVGVILMGGLVPLSFVHFLLITNIRPLP